MAALLVLAIAPMVALATAAGLGTVAARASTADVAPGSTDEMRYRGVELLLSKFDRS